MGLTSSIVSIARSTWGSMFGTTRDQARIDAWHDGMAGPPLDRINQNPYPPPFQNPQDLDVYSREASEMRFAYQRFYASEPTFQSAIDGKVSAIAGLDVSIQPCDESSPVDKKAAEFCRDAITNCPGGFSGLIENILRPAFLTGFSITEKWLGGIDNHHCFDRLRPKWNGLWAPRRMASIDTNYMRFQLDEARQITGVINTRLGLKGYSPDRVLIFTHRKIFENPYGRSDGRSAYRACQMIENAYKLWYIAIKNYSAPFITVKTDSKGAILTALQRAMNEARAGGWLTISKQDEIELLNFASAASFQAFERKVMISRQEIYLAVRGSWLPFLEGSQQDGRGDSQVHKVASDAIESLLVQSACEVVNQQLIPDLVRPNFGDQCGLPTMTLGGTNWQETKTQLEVIRTVEKDLGRPVSTKLIYKISQQEPPRDDTDGPPKPPEPAPQPPSPGGLVGMPFDELHRNLNDWNQHGRESFAGPPGPPPHPGLVWKESTHRWVLPDQPSGGGYKPQTSPSEDAAKKAHELIQDNHHDGNMKLVHQAFIAAHNGKLDADDVSTAAGAMKQLNMHQLRALKTFYGVGGTTSNKDPIIENIIAAVQGQITKAKPSPKPEQKPASIEPTEEKKPITPQLPPPESKQMPAGKSGPKGVMPKSMPETTVVKTGIGGSTGAKLVKDSDGNQYVMKDGSIGKGGKPQLINEEKCNEMYRAADVLVPASKFYGDEKTGVKLGRWVEGQTLQQFESVATKQEVKEIHDEIRKGFVFDALFANYDVIGLVKDNIVIDKDHRAFRIDNGGSMTFRAQGGQKTFTGNVTELESLRNNSINPSAASVFGSLTDLDVAKQIKDVDQSKWMSIVTKAPPEVTVTMGQRIKYMKDWADNVINKEEESKKPKPNSKPGKSETPTISDKGLKTGQSISEFKTPEGFSKKNDPNKMLPDETRPLLELKEAKGILAYSGAAYRDINKTLREGTKPNGVLKNYIEAINGAMDKAPVMSSPVTVYRGLADPDGAKAMLASIGNALVQGDKHVTIPGFVSTSTNQGKAKDWGSHAHIVIKAVHGIDVLPYSTHTSEKEMLLPHNSTYKIVSFEPEGHNGKPLITLEQLPPGKIKKG